MSGTPNTLHVLIQDELYCYSFGHQDFLRSRLQWPRGLRHEEPSPAQTLESWVQIPLEARMCVCVYSVFVLLCVEAEAL
jgi:hypothetical protein